MIKIEEPRCRLTGEGIKPPEGAAMNSCGAERSGKVTLRVLIGKDKRVERK